MGCEVGVATTPEAEEEEVRKQRILPKHLHLLSMTNQIDNGILVAMWELSNWVTI